jgi:UDP-glucose 4-epimerase
MKVLVTGGAGFIGSNLCQLLVQDGRFDEVRVIDDFSTGFKDNLDGISVALIEASILEREALTEAAHGVDAVVHLAALGSVPRSIADPERSHKVNATGTLKVLLAARDNGAHVILASSSSVYGANKRLPKVEDMLCQPMSPYAVSKLATEQYAMAFSQVYGMDVLPFRFFNVYGPRQRAGHVYAAVIPVFVDAALRGERLPINGDGTQSRDFTYVGTVADTIRQALVKRVSSSPLNLAFGTRTPLVELVDSIRTELGVDVSVLHRDPRTGDVPHSQADSTLLRGRFPSIDPVPLERGLRETIRWMRTAPR